MLENELRMTSASDLKLPMMKAKAPTIEHFFGERHQEVVVGAHAPGKAGKRQIDGDKRRAQERHFAAEDSKTEIDVTREGIGEAVNDREIRHGPLL
jgi:hypothetical protein